MSLIKAHAKDFTKSKDLLLSTLEQYSDSNHGILIQLINSEICLLSNDIKQAIEILKNIEKNDPSYYIA